MSTSRRGFLKTLGVGLAAVAVAPKFLKAAPVPLNSNRRGMCVLTEEEVKQLWANVWNEQPQTYSLICSPEMKRQILMTPKERRIDRRLRKSRKRVIKSPAEYPDNELK